MSSVDCDQEDGDRSKDDDDGNTVNSAGEQVKNEDVVETLVW